MFRVLHRIPKLANKNVIYIFCNGVFSKTMFMCISVFSPILSDVSLGPNEGFKAMRVVLKICL